MATTPLTCLVTGANRGLGYEFVQQLLARSNYNVIATCRDPSNLSSSSSANANLTVLHDERADYEMFHVGGDKPMTVMDFASVVAEVFGVKDYTPLPCGRYRFGDTRHICSDVSKLKALGWMPKNDVYRSVEDYKAWLDTAENVGDILAYCNRQMAKMNVVRDVASV